MNSQSDSDLRKEAENWLSSNFQRLFDLYQRSDKDDPRNYFNFKELFPIAYLGAQSYAQLESYLARLDATAWGRRVAIFIQSLRILLQPNRRKPELKFVAKLHFKLVS